MNQRLQAQDKRDIVAQWSFDTRPILGRFHIWLDDVEIEWTRGEPAEEFTRELSFLDGRMERLFAMTGAVTALGTQVFGRPGAGASLDKAGLNQVKKDADAISAYAMSESLWYLSRQLPENHAIMVCLGEGLMPKAGETPEMGSNPQIGFGRVYARPEVARWLDRRVVRLVSDPSYGWDGFYGEIKSSGITVWGAAIDTLENTSRFAKGSPTGPMTILHLFNQPLHISRPYEGYVGMVAMPREIVQTAADQAVLINFRTPRARMVDAIERTYPGIRREHIHVWTLGGKSRAPRIANLWKAWSDLGVHVVEDGWLLPSGFAAFTESGTYAPTFRAGTWKDEGGSLHLFIIDGYAASAEAVQSATLGPMLGLDVSMVPFTSRFDLPYDQEQDVMRLDPDKPDFGQRLGDLTGHRLQRRDGGQLRPDDPRGGVGRPAAGPHHAHRGRLLPREAMGRAGGVRVHAPRPVFRRAWRGGAVAGRLPRDRQARVAGRRQADHHDAAHGRDARAEPPGVQPAAQPVPRRRAVRDTRGEDLRLGTHPERAADALRRGAGVRRLPSRYGFTSIASRPRSSRWRSSDGSSRCCVGTSVATRSGSRGWTSSNRVSG